MSQIFVPGTTAKGGLYSITDSTRQWPAGMRYVDYGADGVRRVYIYGYNAVGSAMVADNLYQQSYALATTSPNWIAIADNLTNLSLAGAAQSAIPSTYWGWFQVEGLTPNRIYVDCIDQNGTLSCTAAHALAVVSGVLADAALAQTDSCDLGIACETRNSTTVYMYLIGRIATTTS